MSSWQPLHSHSTRVTPSRRTRHGPSARRGGARKISLDQWTRTAELQKISFLPASSLPALRVQEEKYLRCILPAEVRNQFEESIFQQHNKLLQRGQYILVDFNLFHEEVVAA